MSKTKRPPAAKSPETPESEAAPTTARRPQDFDAFERAKVVLETRELGENELGGYLRRHGLHREQLEQWRSALEESLTGKPRRQRSESQRIRELEREVARKDKALAEATALIVLKKKSGDSVRGGRGRRHEQEERELTLALIDEAVAAGARQDKACEMLGLDERTVQRWRGRLDEGNEKGDLRRGPKTKPANALTDEEWAQVRAMATAPEFVDMTPHELVPKLADMGARSGARAAPPRGAVHDPRPWPRSRRPRSAVGGSGDECAPRHGAPSGEGRAPRLSSDPAMSRMLSNAALAATLVMLAPVATWAGPLSGTVLDGTTLAPVAAARVEVEGTALTAVTDAAGRYRIADVPEGELKLRVVAAGFEVALEVVAVPAEGLEELVLAVLPPGERVDQTGETIVVVERAPILKTTPGQEELSREELTRLPGTRGDAVSSVKSLPGVANADAVGSGPGLLVIRGAAPEDSVFLLDGIEIPLVYHFFGLQSILPSEFIDDIEFLPGGFGAEQGRATGGIVAIRTRPSRAQALQGFAELSFINVAGYLEGPLWKEHNVNVTVAFRRSLIDFILPAVIPDDVDLSFTTAPQYYDGQLRIDWLPNEYNRVSFLGLGSYDLLSLISNEENPNDPVATGTFDNETSFSRALATWLYKRGSVESTATAAVGAGVFRVEIGDDRYLRGDFSLATLREELEWRPLDRLTLRTGAELELRGSDLDIRLPLPPQEGNPDQGNLTSDPLIDRREDYLSDNYASWLAVDVRPVKGLRLSPGVRFDYYGRPDEATVSPRLGLSYRVAPAWTLRGAAGSYSRPLLQAESIRTDLQPELATQYVLGVDHKLAEGVQLSATGFYTDRRQLIVQDESLVMDDPLDAYVNRGYGRSFGAELLARAKADDFFGWIAYTVSRSDRVDGPGQSSRLFDFDQTHNFIIVGSYKLGNWEFGGRWQYSTGQPETPVTGSTYLADLDVYIPTFGALNSSRIESAHQLDLRIDRYWQLDTWKISAFLDVTNVYAHAQTLGYQYNFDYSEREAFETIPIFPAIGVRGSF